VYRNGFITTAARADWKGFVSGDAEEGDLADSERRAPFIDTTAIEQTGYTLEFLDPEGLGDEGAHGDGTLYRRGRRKSASGNACADEGNPTGAVTYHNCAGR
jgi:hypothetical protein